ncbi:wingless-type MMTV integration site family, member 3 precursor [Saccoglossus kowalevskii]|uniref:Protein Wnt n=1 Tax=Saccoglossus kowalevskii TaxID=10224 RepID=B5M217_SACKO|nr:wingless-type MMTV integration site family, member 3 precursor [Saccoglossus kowalevskii]ACH68429.1 wingless-type MMTV integration site family member 3 protein [Saccoglossus kowalevskii]
MIWCCLFLCFLLWFQVTAVPMWWALGVSYSPASVEEISCGQIPGLVSKQLRFCRRNQELMPSVAEGAQLGIRECQNQFKGRRWNCTTVGNDQSVFGNVLNNASRETAFVHAILSAGLVHTVTRACASGELLSCGCDSKRKPPPEEGWKWGGCSEDIRYGTRFSRDFLDPQENPRYARSVMNLHNNEAGRQTIAKTMETQCKCHGLSGSCEVKTCWKQQSAFKILGDLLKEKYDSAPEMKVTRHKEMRGWQEELIPKYDHFKQPTSADLIYYEPSPNFCKHDPSIGSFGTEGRRCNATSNGIEGCDLMCCGRGYNTIPEEVVERCECQFIWCCKVKCKSCRRMYDLHTCK